jgi:iron complex outermembrane receptor protein
VPLLPREGLSQADKPEDLPSSCCVRTFGKKGGGWRLKTGRRHTCAAVALLLSPFRQFGSEPIYGYFLIKLLMLKSIGFIACMWWCACTAQAQDTTRVIAEVTVEAARLKNFTSGQHLQVLDSNLLADGSRNLADILSKNTTVFIKSYGLGSLATPSFRGTGSSHTAVLWNGFNLQNSMNGTADLALITPFLLDEATLLAGASSALFGSGAVGGSIHLNSRPRFARQPLSGSVGLSAGSFGYLGQHGAFRISKRKWETALKFFRHTANNNFTFRNLAEYGAPVQRQQNAALAQWGLSQDAYFRPNERQLLAVRLLHQNSRRQISPSMTTDASQARQSDQATRLAAEWNRSGPKNEQTVRAAFFDEKLDYQDPKVSLTSHSRTKTLFVEAENLYRWGKLQFNSGGHFARYVAQSRNYRQGNSEQTRMAVFQSVKVQNRSQTVVAVVNVRQELYGSRLAPICPSVGLEYLFGRHWVVKGQLARSFRLPTFNDLYWQPGGNPTLKAENGWNAENTWQWQQKSDKQDIDIRITAYTSQVNNWIIWLPTGNFWSPANIARVWARGLESHWRYGYRLAANHQLAVSSAWNVVRSTNKNRTDAEGYNRQLIYTPIWQGNARAEWSWKNWTLAPEGQWTGKRFYTSDNRMSLPAFGIYHLSVQYRYKHKRYSAQVNARAENLFNTGYQLIAWRPMPGRNYSVQLTVGF